MASMERREARLFQRPRDFEPRLEPSGRGGRGRPRPLRPALDERLAVCSGRGGTMARLPSPFAASTALALVICLALVAGAACGARTTLAGDGDGGLEEGITYGGVPFATGMSRFAVFKRDERRDRCVAVTFVGPVTAVHDDLDLPEGWDVEDAWRGEAAACAFTSPAPEVDELERALSVAGRAGWEEPGCEVDLDLTVTFARGETERLHADDVPVPWADCE